MSNPSALCLTIDLNESSSLLRRTVAIYPATLDAFMSHACYDLRDASNNDIVVTTAILKRNIFKHPRAKQMAAAARYGWKFSSLDAFYPENWANALAYAARLSPAIINTCKMVSE